MATLPLDQALALYTRAQSDAERLAALLVITRAAPAQTAEQRLLLRQALGYAFVGRLLRSPPAAPAAAEPDAGASGKQSAHDPYSPTDPGPPPCPFSASQLFFCRIFYLFPAFFNHQSAACISMWH